ncbi:MAG: hypothetical protein IT308_08140 [Anaerolineaceae bacterium]|nr:hypothetical protein [Anaerolineaceae bacterium]
MKKILVPILLLMLVTMACALTGSPALPTAEPTPEKAVLEPTDLPPSPPTEEPAETPQEEPTEAVSPTEPVEEETGGYFFEEFDGDLSDWTPFVIAGDTKKEYVDTFGDRLKFELPNAETYAYVENVAVTYDDVYVETVVETIKGGENGIALFCRGSDKGFYEFRIHTMGRFAGTYEAYRFDFMLRERNKVPYVNLLKDRERISTYDIKAGLDTNALGLMCAGDEIRLFINGIEQLPVNGKDPIRDNVLSNGTVGIAAMSFSQGIVDVEFDSVSTSAP